MSAAQSAYVKYISQNEKLTNKPTKSKNSTQIMIANINVYMKINIYTIQAEQS